MLLVASPAQAIAEQGDAQKLFKTAVARYGAADFEGSLATLKKARSCAVDHKLLARIALYLGANHQALGQKEAALLAFRAALTHDPSLQVDPMHFKREIVQAVAHARAAMQGQLVVTSDPTGAQVLIDGKPAGATPLRRSLPVGPHRVEVRPARQAPKVFPKVIIASGETQSITARWPSVVVAPSTRPAPSTQPVAPPIPAKEHQRLWTWISAGTAVAALGAGLAFGASAQSDYHEYQEERTGQRRGAQLASRIEDKALTANMFYAAAVTLVIGTAVLFFLEGQSNKGERASTITQNPFHATLYPGGVGVMGSF